MFIIKVCIKAYITSSDSISVIVFTKLLLALPQTLTQRWICVPMLMYGYANLCNRLQYYVNTIYTVITGILCCTNAYSNNTDLILCNSCRDSGLLEMGYV